MLRMWQEGNNIRIFAENNLYEETAICNNTPATFLL